MPSHVYPSEADLSPFVIDEITVDSGYASTSPHWWLFPQCTYDTFKFIDRLYMSLISSLDGVSPLIGSKLASEITGNDFTRSRLNMTRTIYSGARFGL